MRALKYAMGNYSGRDPRGELNKAEAYQEHHKNPKASTGLDIQTDLTPLSTKDYMDFPNSRLAETDVATYEKLVREQKGQVEICL